MELTLKERKKLTRLTAEKYRKAAKREKIAILNTFISQTDYESKHAIHLLANEGKAGHMFKAVRLTAVHGSRSARVYEKTYDADVLKALLLSGRRLTINAESSLRYFSTPLAVTPFSLPSN
jgi:hypothetical protein